MRVILVTGASTGIGLATVLHFARSGHRVYAGLRDINNAPKLQRVLCSGELDIHPIQLDVTVEGSVQVAVDQILEQTGRVDVLVNNAGIAGSGALEITPLDQGRLVFETNYFGPLRLAQAVLPAMRAQGGGTIVMVSSIAGRVAIPNQGHYSASKHALEAASEILAQEVSGFNIRLVIIEPGVILTPIFSKPRPEPDHPAAALYAHQQRRLRAFFACQLKEPRLPESVAQAIEQAVTSETPRLRYLVGEDAQTLFEGRRSCSDEEWVANGAQAEDEIFYDWMAERLGKDLFRQEKNSDR